jgi:transposase
MRPQGSAEELERRRCQAVDAVKSGVPQKIVAQTMGVHPNSVWRWMEMDRKSPEALNATPHPGRKREMSAAQERKLARLLKKGAHAHGWRDDLWTAARATEIIRRHLKIEYHVEHVRHLLKERLGWSSQRPEQKARERDEREIRRWKREELPRIKKSPGALRASCLS